MYFQISENIVSQHVDLIDVVNFIDLVLSETTNEARLRADQLALSSEFDINQIESALDLYADDDAFDISEVVECPNCQTLAKKNTVETAIEDGQQFQCSSCDAEFSEQVLTESEVLIVYHFRVALAKRTLAKEELEVDHPTLKRENAPDIDEGITMQLTPSEARDITALLKECFPSSSQDVVNFAAESVAVSIQGKLNTENAETAVQTLITQSHAQELLGEVLVDLAKKFPRKQDRALGFANIIQTKYKDANASFESKMREQVDEAPNVKLDQNRDGFLQRATSLNGLVDLGELRAWADRAEKQICRVRCDGDDKGTGFLISDRLVLTCYHVIQSCFSKSKRKYISVSFDDGSNGQGPEFKIDPEWDIPFAEYSDHDKKLSKLEPEPEKLDFAIIKLSTSAGTDRGCFDLHEGELLPMIGEPTLMAGHPGPKPPLQPLRFSMAAPGFEGTTTNGTRLIYKNSTEKGSSGSPVVDRKFRLIGLHHNRGEENGEFFRNNRGIPIKLVLDFLNASEWKGALEQVGFH